MKDILGQQIQVGDTVTYAHIESTDLQLRVGVVNGLDTSYSKDVVVVRTLAKNKQTENKVFSDKVLVIVKSTLKFFPADFKAKRVVLTGKIPGYSRDQAVRKFESWGAKISESVSTANYVVVTDEAVVKNTQKYVNAKQYSKTIINQTELLKLLAA